MRCTVHSWEAGNHHHQFKSVEIYFTVMVLCVGTARALPNFNTKPCWHSLVNFQSIFRALFTFSHIVKVPRLLKRETNSYFCEQQVSFIECCHQSRWFTDIQHQHCSIKQAQTHSYQYNMLSWCLKCVSIDPLGGTVSKRYYRLESAVCAARVYQACISANTRYAVSDWDSRENTALQLRVVSR